MSEEALYQQKRKAELDEWNADLAKFKAKASGASADAQIEMHNQIKMLETKMQESKAKLEELAKAGESSLESLKNGLESAWESTKTTFADAAAYFKH